MSRAEPASCDARSYDRRRLPRCQLRSSASPSMGEHIGGGHRHLPFARFRQVAGRAVQEDGKPARRLGVEQLRQPRRNHPGEHVAGAAGRHAGIAGRVDEDAAFRRGDDRAVSLEHDVDAMRAWRSRWRPRCGSPARPPPIVPISRAISPGCGVMMTSRSSRPTSAAGIVGEHGERVGVEHQRHRRAVDQRAHERRRRSRVRPRPGPQAMTSCRSSRTRSSALDGDRAVGVVSAAARS